MDAETFQIIIELELTEPGDVWDLYNVFLMRHSQLVKYAKRAPTEPDKIAAAERAERWLKYANKIRQYYESLEN